MILILKFLLLSLCGLILTALPVQAEEGYIPFWPDFWEPNGIKIRHGALTNPIRIYLPGQRVGSKDLVGSTRIQDLIEGGRFIDDEIISVDDTMSHLGQKWIFPLAITLPESLMTSWSFRGGLFEFQSQTEIKDLAPNPDDPTIRKNTTNWRQKSSDRTSLYNDFFNASDKAFADANSNWALSADVTSSRIFLGYYFGVFIPLGEYHRFFKLGFGLGVYYIDLSLKLNLCSQYKISPGNLADNYDSAEGGCVGKTEIDSYSGKKSGLAEAAYFALWERVTKDSMWQFMVFTQGKGNIPDIKLKNHSKDLSIGISSLTQEFFSYTYLF